ncbi:unnamed protein product [Pleuronectes platessa]|uniref:Uncharacterized protein n=1 Tax=Pleuronectes platessa TaxID=8262 RepID=A0A9N7YNC1_PLEPL|nr:unnamed protein product [Pleuronectes platessa]
MAMGEKGEWKKNMRKWMKQTPTSAESQRAVLYQCRLCVEAWHSRTSCTAFGQNRRVNLLPSILLSTLGKSFNILPASKTRAQRTAILEGNGPATFAVQPVEDLTQIRVPTSGAITQ